MNKQYKPRVVDVRHSNQSIEDEAPTIPLKMATPTPTHVLPPVIILRPSWLDLPARKLASRMALLAICAIPGAIVLTAAIHAAWKLS